MNKIIVTVNFTPRCISIMPSCDWQLIIGFRGYQAN
jgi:hypothetical protein